MEETDIYKLLSFLRRNHYLQNPTTNIEIVKHYFKEENNKLSIEDRLVVFADKVILFEPAYNLELIKDFISYWTEHGEKDRKMRFEKETSFDISRRLKTWKRNQDKFNKQPTTQTHKVNDKWL
ncbi:hypothetical protein RPMD05_56 [Rhodobacteraceae phage LS06-2018-MD05]|nr:hypothetical protein RPMD05_56 [Rhodobacteraceae phage LS06-2018-MD05]